MSMTLVEINEQKHLIAKQMKWYKAVVLPNLHLQFRLCKISIDNITKHDIYKNRMKYYYLGKLATKVFDYITRIDESNKEYYALREQLNTLNKLVIKLKTER